MFSRFPQRIHNWSQNLTLGSSSRSSVSFGSKMKPSLGQSRFSTHFNRLTYLGMWTPEVLPDSTAKALFFVYRFLGVSMLLSAVIIQVTDLYFVVGNFRKVTYNFCTSVVVIAIMLKLILLYGRKDHLNQLRMSLWMDSIKLRSPEDIAIHDTAYDQLQKMQKLFYVSFSIFLPIWIVCSYFSYIWGPRQLAFAGYLPMQNMLDDRTYVPALTYQACSGAYVVILLIEADLSMFSIVLQMEAYYQILSRNLLKLDDLYEGPYDKGSKFLKTGRSKEVKVYLKQKESARQILKPLIIRQLEIINYAKNFEFIYYPSMLLQVFAASFLVVMNGLELSMFLQEMSAKLFFQSGYVVLIVIDIFLICYHLTRLTTESVKVGTAAYSTAWYKMDADLRRSLCMIIIRSQKPIRITAGKLFNVDLTTYLHMLRNIYSWLMLFRQLGSK